MKWPTKVIAVLAVSLASTLDLSSAADANWRNGISKTHPCVYLNAEIKSGLKQRLSAASPEAQRFKEMVDSAVFGGRDVYGLRGAHAALLYQLVGIDAYAEKAIEIVEQQVVLAESKINVGQRPPVAGDQYLHAGRAIGDLACVYDWCHDKLTADQKRRWLAYANQTVWNLWHHKEAQWGGQPHPWAGWSVNNPGNNYYYSFLTATLWLGVAAWNEDPGAEEYLRFFREEKIGNQLIPYFQQRLPGGGSREGTGYGVAHRSVFEIFGIWKASTGEDLARELRHPADSALYMIHSTVPTMDFINPVGDHARDRTGKLFDYHRSYMLRAQTLLDDPRIRETAQFWLNHGSVPRMNHGFMLADDFSYLAMDLSPAFVWNYQWKREQEPLIEWTRQFLFARPGCFVVFDCTRTDPDVETSWIVNLPKKPVVEGNRATVSNGKASLTVQSLLPETCKTQIVDWTSLNPEADQARKIYTGGWRLDRIPSQRKPEQVFLHVLHVDDAVSHVVQKSVPDTRVVEVSLADGSVVSVEFNQNGAVSGAIRITKSGKSVLDRALASTVDRLPTFSQP